MDDWLKQELMSYYDARAPEYDEIYVGKGPACQDPRVYRKDVERIARIVSSFGSGHLIDIGCGTGFWLSYYAPNCSLITLVDQSERMLLECRGRIESLGVGEKCRLVRADFFEVTFEDFSFDSAFVGFSVSHLSLELEQLFFQKLKRVLKPTGSLILIDSAWSTKRKQFRKKEGVQERTLNDGRSFTIFKRYFDKSDVKEMLKRYCFQLDSWYIGEAFLTATGTNL